MKKAILHIAALILLAVLSSSVLNAQELVMGRVIDTVNKMIPQGVTVTIAGKTIILGQNGEFTVTLPNGKHKITARLIGYVPLERTFRVPLEDSLILYMVPEIEQLQSVVVSTGYQQVPKARATGSFTTISASRLNEQIGTEVINRLEGIANSFSVDRKTNSASIMVRGLSTIRGPREPLIILDNFPYEGDLSNINPNDVTSITILKDAAAASIWGAHAGNGVIVITTKRALYNQPTRVEFSSNLTVGQRPDLFYQPRISSADFIEVERMLFEEGFYSEVEEDSGREPLSPVVEYLIAARDGKITKEQAETAINALKDVDFRSELDRYMYRNPVNQQYSLQLRSGKDNISWLLFAGHDRNIGELWSRYNRTNIKSENRIRFNRKFEVALQALYTQSETMGGRPGMGDFSLTSGDLPPYTRLATEAGEPLPVIGDYRITYVDTVGDGRVLNWRYYPLEDHTYEHNKQRLQHLIGNVTLSYKFMPGLDGRIYYQYQQQTRKTDFLREQSSYYVRNFINLFTELAPGETIYNVPLGGIMDISENRVKGHNLRGQLHYEKKWSKHAINVLSGGEVRSLRSYDSSNRLYGFNPETLTSVNVDYKNPYPTFVTGRNSFIYSGTDMNEAADRFVSWFGNGAYTYDDRYIFSLSARRDASNLFGVTTNNRWNPFWSAGVAWNVSLESFYDTQLISYLKLRITYGYSGNVDQSMTAVTTIGYGPPDRYTQMPYVNFIDYYNPDLRWEKVGTLNVGADFSFKGARISGSLEYYTKRATDLFGSAPLDYTSGIGSRITKNVASMKAHGIDLELNTINTTGLVKWSTGFFINYYRDEILSYYLTSERASRFVNGNNTVAGLEGKPVYSMFSYPWAGLDPENGDPMGIFNGEISKDYRGFTGSDAEVDDLHYHGPVFPAFSGGMGNTFSWRNLSLTARVSYKFGYYFRRPSLSYSNLYSTRNGHGEYSKRWQKPGDEMITHVPSQIYPLSSSRDAFYNGAEINVSKGDHIRLQYINLSYLLNNGEVRMLPLKQLKISIVASNLGFLWRANKYGIDPDYDSVPPAPTFSIGLNANF